MPQANTQDRCNGGSCVAADVTSGGVLVTSTIPGNEGFVLFTHDEWDAFIPAVKAGKWDHTLSGALVS